MSVFPDPDSKAPFIKRLLSACLNLILILASSIVALVLVEVGLMMYQQKQQAPGTPLYIPTDKAYIYSMNPEHQRTNSFGLRDREFSITKPADTFRILVLGDSLAFGNAVRLGKTFPKQLEQQLKNSFKTQGKKIEVINAGVSGYTPYNQLHYYLEEGRHFSPDLVLVAFCMNDVANPRLHWSYTPQSPLHIPDAAIPNHIYDSEHIQPLIEQRFHSLEAKIDGSRSLIKAVIQQTRTFQTLNQTFSYLLPSIFLSQEEQQAQPKIHEATPTYITGEDSLSIEVLTRADSSEWQWLHNMYQQIKIAADNDGIPLIITIFPLAYQLDEGYPFLPQQIFSQYCNQENWHCLDLLPEFKQHSKEQLFLLNQGRGYDVWHLTQAGHKTTALIMADYLQQSFPQLFSPQQK